MQKSLTQLTIFLWGLMAFIGMIKISPSVQTTYDIPALLANLITLVGSAILVGILDFLPLMLGLGVLLYRNQWKKAEERSIAFQTSIFESYLITLVRPLFYQLIIFIPLMILVGYLLEKGNISNVFYGVSSIFYGYVITFLIGVFVRLGVEFFEYRKQNNVSKE